MRSISGELTPTFSNADFNREGMSALFEAGRQLGRGSTPWSSLPPGIGPDELDPSDVHDATER